MIFVIVGFLWCLFNIGIRGKVNFDIIFFRCIWLLIVVNLYVVYCVVFFFFVKSLSVLLLIFCFVLKEEKLKKLLIIVIKCKGKMGMKEMKCCFKFIFRYSSM